MKFIRVLVLALAAFFVVGSAQVQAQDVDTTLEGWEGDGLYILDQDWNYVMYGEYSGHWFADIDYVDGVGGQVYFGWQNPYANQWIWFETQYLDADGYMTGNGTSYMMFWTHAHLAVANLLTPPVWP